MTTALFNKRFFRILILVIAVIAGAYFIWFSSREHHSSRGDSQSFVSVTRGDIEDVITSLGKVEAREYVDVGAQVSGQLKKLAVELGQPVQAGQLIAEIDPRVYNARVEADQARLKTLRAQLAQQQAQVVLAEEQLARNQRLIKAQAISTSALEIATTALKVEKAKDKALQAQIEEATSTLQGDLTNLSFTKIFAPMSGVVVAQSAREGQTLNANQQAPVIVQIANLDVVTVRAQVAEADVTRIKQGMPVYFTILGALNRRWNSTVKQILPSPELINDVVLYNALIDVENRDRQLMTGMSTQMFFVSDSAKNVLLIPVTALREHIANRDTKNAKAYRVRVKRDGDVKSEIILIGLTNRQVAQVVSGLKEGDEVAIGSSTDQNNGDSAKRRPRMRGMFL